MANQAKLAKQERANRTREQYPHLENLLDVFRNNRFRSTDVFALIDHQANDTPLPEITQKKFDEIAKPMQSEMGAAAVMLMEGFLQSDAKRSRKGTESLTPMERLEGDMKAICNFDNNTPHHRTRQDINDFIREQEKARAALEEIAPKELYAPEQEGLIKEETASVAPAAATAAVAGAGALAASQKIPEEKGNPAAEPRRSPAAPPSAPASARASHAAASSPQTSEQTNAPTQDAGGQKRFTARHAGIAAGAATGLATAATAATNWRDRVSKPESRTKAIVFASIAAVSAVAVGTLMLHRGNGMNR